MYDLLCHNSFLLSEVVDFGCESCALLQSRERDHAPSLAQILGSQVQRTRDDKSLYVYLREPYRREPASSFLAAPVRIPSTSSSRMMMKSSPSSLISVPEYLPNRIRSPSFTARGNTLPSSLERPLPTEITSPSCGLSLALSGMMMPPRVVSASSTRRTRMRSWSGVNLAIVATPFNLVEGLSLGKLMRIKV